MKWVLSSFAFLAVPYVLHTVEICWRIFDARGTGGGVRGGSGARMRNFVRNARTKNFAKKGRTSGKSSEGRD